ncbi:MAG: AgmX/PglI C-terminal domain-containing protein [Myxococcota bacterium]
MSELDPNDLAAWEVDELPATLDDRIMAAWTAERSDPAPAVPSAPARRPWPWIAAGVAAAAGLLMAWGLRAPGPSGHGSIVATGESHTVVLGDGVSATASSGARLHWKTNAAGLVVEQTAGRVDYRVQPEHPFLVQTPSATVAVTGTTFSVEVQSMSESNRSSLSPRLMALGVALVGATGVAFVAVDSGEVEVSNEHGSVKVAAGQRAVATDVSSPRTERAKAVEETVAAAPAVAAPAEPGTPARARRDAALTKIRAALASRPATPSSGHGDEEEASLPKGTLTKDYIRERVREDLIPLARDCYNDVLADDPDFAGKLVLDFDVLGDETVGGIVDGVVPGEGSNIEHPGFVECMSESMMSVVFEAPEGGGQVHISYPFTFEPAED